MTSSDAVPSLINKISSELSSFISKTPETNVICSSIAEESEELLHKTQPFNLKTFRLRVNTFSPGLWSLRYLSPLTCARYGWLLLEKEVLQCVTCHAIVCTSLPSSNDSVAYDIFIEKLGKKIIDGHVDGCGWQHNPSPEFFTHPPNISSKDHLKNFTNNARSLLAMDDSLPFVDNNKLCDSWGINKLDLENVFSSDNDLTENQITAALLCLCGWTTSKKNFLLCNLCQRSVGIWNFCSRKTYNETFHLQNKNLKVLSNEKKISTLPEEQEKITKADQNDVENCIASDSSEDSTDPNLNNEINSTSSETQTNLTDSIDSTDLKKQNIAQEGDKMDVVSSTSDTEKAKDCDSLNKESNKRPSSTLDDDPESSSKRPCLEWSSKAPFSQLQKESDQLSETKAMLHDNVIESLEKEGKTFFDPVGDHRYWCGFIVERSLSPELHDLYYHDLRGFQVLINQLKSYIRPVQTDTSKALKCKNNTEGLRAVRNLLDSWLTTDIDNIDEDALLQ